MNLTLRQLSTAQRSRLELVAKCGDWATCDATTRVLIAKGLLEEVPRLYFGPRDHRWRVSAAGRALLEQRRAPS